MSLTHQCLFSISSNTFSLFPSLEHGGILKKRESQTMMLQLSSTRWKDRFPLSWWWTSYHSCFGQSSLKKVNFIHVLICSYSVWLKAKGAEILSRACCQCQINHPVFFQQVNKLFIRLIIKTENRLKLLKTLCSFVIISTCFTLSRFSFFGEKHFKGYKLSSANNNWALLADKKALAFLFYYYPVFFT